MSDTEQSENKTVDDDNQLNEAGPAVDGSDQSKELRHSVIVNAERGIGLCIYHNVD